MERYENFAIIPVDEEQKGFIIALGNVRASTKEFPTIEEAKRYIDEKPWELIGATAFAINYNWEKFNTEEE